MAEPIDWSKVPRSFGEGGWFWLSEDGDRLREQLAEEGESAAEDLLKSYRQCFQTAPGQRVLAHLIGMTLNQPTWVPGIGDPVHNGFAREGQNSIVRHIIGLIGHQTHTPIPVPQPPKETPNGPEQPAAQQASRDFTPQPDRPAARKRRRSPG